MSEASSHNALLRIEMGYHEDELRQRGDGRGEEEEEEDVGGDEGDLEEDEQIRRPKVSIQEPKEEEEGGEEDMAQEDERSRRISRLSKSSRTTLDSSNSGTKSPWSRSRKSSRLELPDAEKMEQEEEQARQRRERAKASVPFGEKRKEQLYKAPKFFTVRKGPRKTTVARDPFSTERELDLPKGGTFHLQKTDRKTTQFVDFKKADRGWMAPRQFEIKKEKRPPHQFWSRAPKGRGDANRKSRRGGADEDDHTRRRSRRELSPDSGMESAYLPHSPVEPVAPVCEDTAPYVPLVAWFRIETIRMGDKLERESSETRPVTSDLDPSEGSGGTGDLSGDRKDGQGQGGEGQAAVTDTQILPEEPKKPKRREIVKKVREERKPTTPEVQRRLPSPPVFKRRTPIPPTPTPPRTPTPKLVEPPLPQIDLPVVPDLPEIVDKETEKRKEKMKFTVEQPPALQEVPKEPKKRRAAPRIRIIPKNLSRPRKSKPAEAPVTSEEMMDIRDPLDFLAKYCIINPDRLPLYEIIFESTVADQTPRYERDPSTLSNQEDARADSDGEKEGRKKKGKSSKKKKSSKSKENKAGINPNILPAERGMNIEKTAMTVEEQHLEKLVYTLDLLHEKMTSYGMQLAHLEGERIRILAARAKEFFPEVTSPDYFPKLKKKGKKSKKEKRSEPQRKLRRDEITDEVIVTRMDDKMINQVSAYPEMKYMEVEIERLKEKIKDVQGRVEQIASEKLLADAFCMNHYFLRQGLDISDQDEFKRQQSELYNRLHPHPDFEMNLEEVEEALQQINNHLITEKEFFFLYNVLNLPGRKKINFQLFCVIAALSEKVTQLDPVIRKMINNFNYNALDIKMDKCKELFDLLEADHMPRGGAQASSLQVELTAGGLKPEHTNYVLHKFNRENRGVVDFLDFVTYVPLFVEIHKRIISDPLRDDLDL